MMLMAAQMVTIEQTEMIVRMKRDAIFPCKIKVKEWLHMSVKVLSGDRYDDTIASN